MLSIVHLKEVLGHLLHLLLVYLRREYMATEATWSFLTRALPLRRWLFLVAFLRWWQSRLACVACVIHHCILLIREIGSKRESSTRSMSTIQSGMKRLRGSCKLKRSCLHCTCFAGMSMCSNCSYSLSMFYNRLLHLAWVVPGQFISLALDQGTGNVKLMNSAGLSFFNDVCFGGGINVPWR